MRAFLNLFDNQLVGFDFDWLERRLEVVLFVLSLTIELGYGAE